MSSFYTQKLNISPFLNKWNNILTRLYGDYMKFPSEEKRGIEHSGAFFEPDIEYIEFINGRC